MPARVVAAHRGHGCIAQRLNTNGQMDGFDSLKIDLNGLRGDAETYTFRLGDSYFESVAAPEVRRGDADVTLSVRKVQGSFFELSFHIEASVIVPCDRCLEEMEQQVDTSYAMSIKYGDDYDEGDDCVTLPEGEAGYNVARVIYDTVALAIPIMHVHPDGQCDKEMSSLLEEHLATGDGSNDDCDCDDDNCDPRWEALKKLKDNN